MKRLVKPQPNGGVPLTNEYFTTLQNEGFDHLKQMLVGLNSPMVLSGCKVPLSAVLVQRVFNDGGDGTGSNFVGGGGTGPTTTSDTLTSGYVWIDGDIMYFPGTTLAAPFYIKADVASFTRVALQDGTTKNQYVTTTATATTSRPTSGQYITCNPSPDLTYQGVMLQPVRTDLTAEINTRQTQVTAEVTARTNADTQLSQRINTLTDTVDTKATKRCERIDWTDLPLAPGYTTAPNLQYQRAQYMRDEFGFVHLRGLLVNGTQYTKTNPYGGTTIGTMPVGARPTWRHEVVRPVVYNFFGSINNACSITTNYISIQQNGGFSNNVQYVLIDPNNAVPTTQAQSDPNFYLDGISYYSL